MAVAVVTSQPPVHTPGVSPSNLNSKACPLESHSSKFSDNFLRTQLLVLSPFVVQVPRMVCFQHINLTDTRGVLGMGQGGAKVGGRPFAVHLIILFHFSTIKCIAHSKNK